MLLGLPILSIFMTLLERRWKNPRFTGAMNECRVAVVRLVGLWCFFVAGAYAETMASGSLILPMPVDSTNYRGLSPVPAPYANPDAAPPETPDACAKTCRLASTDDRPARSTSQATPNLRPPFGRL